METATSRNLKSLFEILEEKLLAQPIAKLNREAAVTKSWKIIAELRQNSCFGKSDGKKRRRQSNSTKKGSDNLKNTLSFVSEDGLLKNQKHMPVTTQLLQLGGARHAAFATPNTDLGSGTPYAPLALPDFCCANSSNEK